MSHLLPGGLVVDGQLMRDFAFRELDGCVEMALGAPTSTSGPARVTATLSAALEQVAGGPATPERVDALCIADRQFLMRHLARRLTGEPVWMTSACQHCAAQFDFQVAPSELPVAPAGPSFPQARVRQGGHELVVRAPTAADQRWLLAGRHADERRALVERCLDGSPPDGIIFDSDLLDAIDRALEAMCPEVTTEIGTECPECGQSTTTRLDPYRGVQNDAKALLRDVHRLASAYHWSEPDILALPRERRMAYLELIDQSRGMVS